MVVAVAARPDAARGGAADGADTAQQRRALSEEGDSLGGCRGWQGRRALGQHLQRGRGGRARGAAPGAAILGADPPRGGGRGGGRRRPRGLPLLRAGGGG